MTPILYPGWWRAQAGKYHRLVVTEALDRPAVCGISIQMINDYKAEPAIGKRCERCLAKVGASE